MALHSLLLSLFCVCFGLSKTAAQTLYSKAYGNRTDPAVIYIHGGPRGNSTLFEGTAAEHLAEQGLYVIVYDRRGEGRSGDPKATLTFQEALQDINKITKQYHLKRFSLIGHSFGGLVATLYTEAHPKKVENLILVGALFAQQESYDHILDSCTVLANKANDTAALNKIGEIKNLDMNTADYRKKNYEIASHFRFFSMPNPTAESIALRDTYEHSVFGKENIRNDEAPLLFYKNETRVNIDTKPILENIKKVDVHLAGIYGLQDGVFSHKQLADMQQIVGEKNFYTIDNCSHYPFVDQRDAFTETLLQIVKGN